MQCRPWPTLEGVSWIARTRIDCCRFGGVAQRSYLVERTSPWLHGLDAACVCRGPHAAVLSAKADVEEAKQPLPVALRNRVASRLFIRAKEESLWAAGVGRHTAALLVPSRSRRAMWLHLISDRWKGPARWSEIQAQRFRRREHINLGELEGPPQPVRLIAKRPELHGSRLLGFADSRAVIGAVAKGGSTGSFSRLLQKWRRPAAHSMAADLSPARPPLYRQRGQRC